MGKRIKAYKVTNLSKVDTTLYIEGDHFITDRSVGILVNGKIKTIGNNPPDLSDYAKKTDIPDVSDYAKKTDIPDVSDYAKKTDIPDVSDFVDTATVQQMIDDALNTGGGDGA